MLFNFMVCFKLLLRIVALVIHRLTGSPCCGCGQPPIENKSNFVAGQKLL